MFIDDSQQQDPPRKGLGHLLAVGAVSFPAEQLAGYASDLQTIREELGIPAEEELKWAPSKGTFLHGKWDTLRSLRAEMLEAAARRDVKSMVVILDHSARYSDYTQAEAGAEILKWLYERVSMHLGDVDDFGLVIADKPGGGTAEENKWLAASLALTNRGTEYVQPDKIILPIVTAHSHHVPHIQLADLVVAATTAAYAGRPRALDLVPLLRPLMHRHRLNYINGAGIVQFPEHMNLYYWAFGETGWARPSKMCGWALPREGLAYADDPGLPPGASAQAPVDKPGQPHGRSTAG
ncbi:DUF3800 domain-containing protein [Amycolatopsis sp. NPDC088138]|uniref:DUF3800 domain-containing protein n=1 Tax=Amycolatopsis sp. NPDC088138 TaxID=3363938 RepID=UPI003810C958